MIDKGTNKSELRDKSGISTALLAQLGRIKNLKTAVLIKIYSAPDWGVSDIIEVKDVQADTKKKDNIRMMVQIPEF